MIEEVYRNELPEEKVVVIIIPDIKGVAIGRNVGYFFVDVPQDIKTISGTKIREGLSIDVPKKVKYIIEQFEITQEAIKKGHLYSGDDIFSS